MKNNSGSWGWRRLKVTTRMLFICALSSYTLITYFASINFRNGSTQLVIDREIQSILDDTPYLWRKFNLNTNESMSNRVENQKLWIKRLSKTEFIKTAPTKLILVQDGMDLYYSTDGVIQCPYAPEFEVKCKLVEENWTHALLGSWKYNGVDAVSGIRNWERRLYEPLVPHHVKQILYILESPHIAKNANLGRNNALVASYWKGSDIPTPYRRWISNSSKGLEIHHNVNVFPGKTKMVVAMISNCLSKNNRLSFIQELQKYVQVDVYGDCGRFSCPRDNHKECLEIFRKEYKFYLAIENSNCEDYITEKFFDNALQNDLIPIVMGAHPNTYKAEAPPHSCIHVDNFESVKALADYLHVVSSNETLFNDYFKWKGSSYITEESMADFFCRLCGMLYYSDYVPVPIWNSSATMWKDVNHCLPQGQWYWR